MSSAADRTKQRQLEATLVGVHRGGHFHLAALTELVAELPNTTAAVRLVDAMPGRAEVGAMQVRASGGSAHPIEARLEEILPFLAESRELVILAVDSPRTVADALQAQELDARWVFAYQLIRPPQGGLISLRGAFPPGNRTWREQTAQLVSTLAEFTTERGASFVTGEHARSAEHAAEPLHRAGRASHLKSTLQRITTGHPPNQASLTLSFDGLHELPLLVSAGNRSWQKPHDIAVLAVPLLPVPLKRGQEFAIGEIVVNEGVRFHVGRLRTNGQLLVRGRHVIDHSSVAKAAEHTRLWEQAERERLARHTISRLNPVDVTD